jgi:hypothetical protein
MTEQAIVIEVGETLKKAKNLVGQLVKDRMTREDYGGAKIALDWAQSIDSIAGRLNDGNVPSIGATATAPRNPRPMSPNRLPYYYKEADRLVKIGKSDEGDGTYRHDVPKDNFDEIIATLVRFADSNVRFDTKQLQNQVDRIPRHQSLIVLAVLEEQRVLVNTRRGQWAFVDRAGFPIASRSVWDNISEG